MLLIEDKVYEILESKIDGLKKEERVEKDADQRKTYDEVFDQLTLMHIYKLIVGKTLDTLDYPISTGKEANVFHGTTPEGGAVAVKIYRVNTATYRDFRKYIEGDSRFKNLKMNHRSMIYTWARKEFKNLHRMYDGGVRVPKPITYHKNILVMEYIGDEKGAAPMLKDIVLENPEECLEIIVDAMARFYGKCKLVHGDISEYNVLIPDDDVVIIDVGQSVVLDHPMSDELLERDVKNLKRYFRKYDLKVDADEVLARIRAGADKNGEGNETVLKDDDEDLVAEKG